MTRRTGAGWKGHGEVMPIDSDPVEVRLIFTAHEQHIGGRAGCGTLAPTDRPHTESAYAPSTISASAMQHIQMRHVDEPQDAAAGSARTQSSAHRPVLGQRDRRAGIDDAVARGSSHAVTALNRGCERADTQTVEHRPPRT